MIFVRNIKTYNRPVRPKNLKIKQLKRRLKNLKIVPKTLKLHQNPKIKENVCFPEGGSREVFPGGIPCLISHEKC